MHEQPPLVQAAAAGHTLPQVPQLFWSVCGSMQMPEQAANPALQTHTPPWQAVFAPQTCPHAPQFFGSIESSVQTPLQAGNPGAQPGTHWLFRQ